MNNRLKENASRMIKLKCIFAAIVVSLLFSSHCVAADSSQTPSSFEGNLLKITTVSDFEAGQMERVIIDPEIGDGALLLENCPAHSRDLSRELAGPFV